MSGFHLTDTVHRTHMANVRVNVFMCSSLCMCNDSCTPQAHVPLVQTQNKHIKRMYLSSCCISLGRSSNT